MNLKIVLLLLISPLLLAEEVEPQQDAPSPPQVVEQVTIPDNQIPIQKPEEGNPDPVNPPGDSPDAPIPDENKEPPDPLADFQRPDYITIQYVYEIRDVLTGAFIKEDFSNELDTQKTDDYEKVHGLLTRAQWIEIKEMGLLKIYVNFYDGWL